MITVMCWQKSRWGVSVLIAVVNHLRYLRLAL